jgi:hypothetical protein
MRGDCTVCWYWWNLWPSLLKFSFHNGQQFHLYQQNNHLSPEIIEHKEDHNIWRWNSRSTLYQTNMIHHTPGEHANHYTTTDDVGIPGPLCTRPTWSTTLQTSTLTITPPMYKEHHNIWCWNFRSWLSFGFYLGGGDCHARDHMVFGLVSTYSLIACQCY